MDEDEDMRSEADHS
uniref:Uncharacterized protein n=1 Tax=Moniliophthora roreri TaxID=221103 RepID=A0A0W0FTQ6_MONRR